ncbi:MAG TPA: HdeD family acid-resistance protein [Acidimicrobiales bacterium]|jgi:uncharacterized membrane protein HdeD (DUF308 family)|nr:HdeD family acid-resistance protein [Acidimicrobiales bacterium]
MIDMLVGNWRTLAIRGAAAALFGLLALIWPGPTVWALVLLFGAYVLVDGVTILAAALSNAPEAGGRRGWHVFEGVVSIGVGIVTFIWPAITALALLWVIAAWAFVTGVVEIVAAVRLREVLEREWILAAVGVLSILFAVVLAVDPGAGALGITWAIGWYALLSGALYAALAWRVRKLERGEGPSTARTRAQPRPLAT